MANSVHNPEKNDMDNLSFYTAGDQSSSNLNESELSIDSVVENTHGNFMLSEVGAGDRDKTLNNDCAQLSQDFISNESSGNDVSWKRKREPSPDFEENRSLEETEDSEESSLEGSRVGAHVPSVILGRSLDISDKLVNIDDNLPETVTLLTTPEGAKIYIVGTAHFSHESQEDVAKIIQAVQPHVVLVELCKARVNILQLDEKTILEEAKNINFEKIRSTIYQNGVVNGLMYILLLSMTAHITKQLGMAPGGEFRRALTEAKKFPHCIVHLGDRPIHITLQRALSSLSWWQTIKVTWHLLTSKGPISKEEVEKCKQRDLLEEMLAEMTGEFPDLSTVFVKERDIYLAHSLHLAAAIPQRLEGIDASRVVGVVGMGHMPGIVEHWNKVRPEDIPPLLEIPPPTLTSKVVRIGTKVSLIGLVLWGCYRISPLHRNVPSISALRTSLLAIFK